MKTPLLVRALRGEAIERPPVWLMRQAGRYLEEYRALKTKNSFLEMCRNPELAFEVSMQPIRFFQPDAAIVFADILLPAQCLGIDVTFAPGPKVTNPIRGVADIRDLRMESPARILSFVPEALTAIRNALEQEEGPRKAVIGFAGAPWTMACYLIDQGPYKHFEQTAIFAKEHPKAFAFFLETISRLTEEYLLAQVEGGADVVQLFESWGGILSLDDYRRYALPSCERIITSLARRGVPVILYVNGSSHLLHAMTESGASCLSVDSRTPLAAAYSVVGKNVTIQGNLDPTDLFLQGDEVYSRTREMISAVPDQRNYIANLGHGVLQSTPRESVRVFIEAVKAGWVNAPMQHGSSVNTHP